MDWGVFDKTYADNYSFLEKIFPGSIPREQLHLLISRTATIVSEALANPLLDRTIVWLPYRGDIPRWIMSLACLQIIKDDFKSGTQASTDFKPGQKLLINGVVVEYLGETYDPDKGLYIKIRCLENGRQVPYKSPYIDWSFYWNEKLHFQSVGNERALDKYLKVHGAITSVENKTHPLDNILGIKTLGNKGCCISNSLLVSPIGQTETFITNTLINKEKLIDLFLWGKVDPEGNVSEIDKYKLDAEPVGLIARDLLSVRNYLNTQNHNNKLVVIDGVKPCTFNLQLLDDILDKGTKTIIFSDMSDAFEIAPLRDRGFKIWQWNKNNLSQTLLQKTDSQFNKLNKQLENYINGNTQVIECKNESVDHIINSTVHLVAGLKEDYERITDIKWDTIILANQVTRLIRIPNSDWLERIKKQAASNYETLLSYKQWIEDNTLKNAHEWQLLLDDLNIVDLDNDTGKITKLKELLIDRYQTSRGFYEKTTILTRSEEEAKESEIYWTSILPSFVSQYLCFISLDQFINDIDNYESTNIIVSGWLGYERMSKLLNSQNIILPLLFLFFPQEKRWYENVLKRRAKAYDFENENKNFMDTLGISYEISQMVSDTSSKETTTDTDDDDLIDFEIRIKTYQYKKYFPEDPINSPATVKLVVFANNYFSLMTESHKIPLVTDIIENKSVETDIAKANVNQLQEGDYVLFLESDHDLIRGLAEKKIEEAGGDELYTMARLWKKALREEYNEVSRDIDRLISRLSANGCKRHKRTIQEWLFNKEQIGPGDIEDLDMIVKATRNKELEDNLEKVKSAIEQIRSVHTQASEYLRQKLFEALPNVLHMHEARTDESSLIDFELPNFGKVYLLKVSEIGTSWEKVDETKTNKLLRKETNSLWQE